MEYKFRGIDAQSGNKNLNDMNTGVKINTGERFRVNVLHGGKERWKYCRTIERAKYLQMEATKGGLNSIICKKIDGCYVSLNDM